MESSRLRGTALPRGSQSQFYSDGISFRVVFSQSFWLRVLPGGARLVQSRWMPMRRILGDGWTCGVSFRPFPNSSSWWWLTRPVFLTRTSCHKTTHANGYYGAWPGWVVSVSVLLLTAGCSLLKSKYLRVSAGMNRKSALLRRLAPQGEGRLMSQNLSWKYCLAMSNFKGQRRK